MHKRLELPFSDKKIILQNTGQMAVPLEFCLFPRREKPQNSASNHFSEEKYPQKSIPNNFRMRKTSEFRSESF